MDPETNLPDLADDLGDTIDDLEEALDALLSSPLRTLTSTLPTLDKAKLHILTAYTLESLLFSAITASGADAKAHRVFAELARLKTYFGKIKAAEAAGEGKTGAGPTAKLDKGAAARFIRHGLSGNERYDKERAERQAKEKARAALKAKQMAQVVNKTFDDDVESMVQEELGRKRKAEAVAEDESSDSDSDDDSDGDSDADSDADEAANPPTQPAKPSTPTSPNDASSSFYGASQTTLSPGKEPTSSSKKSKKEKTTHTKRRSNPSSKRSKRMRAAAGSSAEKNHELILPERGEAPRTRGEMFSALLAGTYADERKAKEGKSKEKGNGKEKKKT